MNNNSKPKSPDYIENQETNFFNGESCQVAMIN